MLTIADGTNALEGPGQIDSDHTFPDLIGRVGNGLRLKDAGVVHEHIEQPELGFSERHRTLPVFGAAYVQPHESRRGTQLAGKGRAEGFVDVADDDPTAMLHDRARVARSHPLGAPADERDLAG
jgi:hypothetical protein